MKHLILLLSLIPMTLLGCSTVRAQEPPLSITQKTQEPVLLTDAELAQMLAPIALYPDSLLTHILIAATYPIEIVEAHRWLKKNKQLSVKKLGKLLENLDWDESVKALISFERVLSRLSDNLTWTLQLGDAFLQDEVRLLDSIQALRNQAKIAGNLDKMDNMDVSYDNDNIVIEPVEKEIVYVPYYDTRMIYGTWHWASFPPVYWTPHHSAHVSYYHPFHWHSGVHISFNYFFSAFHWHNRHVVVVKPHRSRYYRSRHSISRGGYAKRWKHQVSHRKGVAYRNKHISKKYRSDRVRIHKANKHLDGRVEVKGTHNRVMDKLVSTHQVINNKTQTTVHFKHKTVKEPVKTKQQYKPYNKQYKRFSKHQKSLPHKKQHQSRVKNTTKNKAVKKYTKER